MRHLLLHLLLLTVATAVAKAQSVLYPNEYDLRQVTLLDGPFKAAQEVNVETLLKYDVDRLLAPFLKEAGLKPKGESFENWIGLDGHVGGHYLSALAISYASTGNRRLRERMDYMLSELKCCQRQFDGTENDGYVGGVPNGLEACFNQIRRGNPAIVWDAANWVPWYNLHKTYAGLRDAWMYGGSEEAKDMFLRLCDWGLGVIAPLSDEQMEQMLGNEYGGMDEMYADAYDITGEAKYLSAAKRFRHQWLFNSMAAEEDNLDNAHANTQVPKVVGYSRIAELAARAGEAEEARQYDRAARFFWQTVVDNRSLAIGGNSRQESFVPAAKCSEYVEVAEGPETCNTNNMLRLTEDLFRQHPEAKYADFFERALLNHMLSSQDPETGGYVYFTSARPAHYRVYSDVNQAMWCCVGTGMENHGKYGEFIYTHSGDSLFVNLFVASELNDSDSGLKLTQQTRFPDTETSSITVNTTRGSVSRKILVRYPGWCREGDMKCVVDGMDYAKGAKPQSYIVIDRQWSNGDRIELTMPMHVTVEELPNVPAYVAVMRGPVLLGARMGTEDVSGLIADDGRWSHIAPGKKISIFDTPILRGSREEIAEKLNHMQPVSGKTLTFTVPGLFMDADSSTSESVSEGRWKNLELEPFFRIHRERYMMYWLSMDDDALAQYQQEKREAEEAALELEARTTDRIGTGEQQPDQDHQMKGVNTNKGVAFDEYYREATEGGFFEYTMDLGGHTSGMSLMVRYWGNEDGNRSFDIQVDGTTIAAENVAGKWNANEFKSVTYPIPSELTKGKKTIVVRFHAHKGNMTGRVFLIQLLKAPIRS